MSSASFLNHNKLLTVSEVADFLRVSERTVCRYIAEGTLKAIKLKRQLRMHRRDLDRFIDSHPMGSDRGL